MSSSVLFLTPGFPLIEGAITVFVGLVLFFFLPASPDKAHFLNDEEKSYVKAKPKEDGTIAGDDADSFSWPEVAKAFTSIHVLVGIISFLSAHEVTCSIHADVIVFSAAREPPSLAQWASAASACGSATKWCSTTSVRGVAPKPCFRSGSREKVKRGKPEAWEAYVILAAFVKVRYYDRPADDRIAEMNSDFFLSFGLANTSRWTSGGVHRKNGREGMQLLFHCAGEHVEKPGKEGLSLGLVSVLTNTQW
ncbi:hypothetical protein B0H14DRAFT_2622556 [Mycena olivaceomarginata]|nr:hypothetical protein B0H14DRAFT_2622556 [Mycena olivaceomarginata]